MKIDSYSVLLALMLKNGLLKDKAFKLVIKYLIRTVTETPDYHCSADYRSIEVIRATQDITSKSAYHRFCSKNFRHDHIVPCQAQYELLMELPGLSEKNIKEFFNKHSLRATITKDQDKKLNDLGLRAKMPWEFHTKTFGYEDYYENPLARYLKSGIMESLEKTPVELFPK